MARRTTKTASADQSSTSEADAPVEVARLITRPREGGAFPSFRIKGEAPRKGSVMRIRTPDGTTYRAKVHGSSEADGETLVETDGLEPEREPEAPPPPSDIVPG